MESDFPLYSDRVLGFGKKLRDAGLVAEFSKGAAVGFMLPQRFERSVTGGSNLAPVSNSKVERIYFQSQPGGPL